ncbi:MAG: Sec-dependent nitrous-oxide reductase [Gemmatimonadaceae bacterium]|nr:Sec-dependent nitrous-oxide reductase [Gemmatimonadaceae bacterium]
MRFTPRTVGTAALAAGALGLLAYACAPATGAKGSLSSSQNAERVYVPPGQHDEFYAVLSGGFNGQLSIQGLPSGRVLKIIPVFSQFPENGWGYAEETKPMLQTTYGFVPWDDTHHPELSQTNGEVDGRWVFINANNTPRIARVDLATMETHEILEIPNTGGNHASPFITPNSEYVVGATRFSVPTPQQDIAIKSFADGAFKGMLTFVRANEPGRMDIAWQILVPGYNYDLAHAGKGPSDGWMFFTAYNSEQAYTKLEAGASKSDKDFIAAVHWKSFEACAKQGKGTTWDSEYRHNVYNEATHSATSNRKTGVRVITPAECPGSIFYLPTPKSPHGADVDPTGQYIVGGGKLATVIPVHSFEKMQRAIAAKAFEKEIDGIPVLKYDAVNFCEVQNPGLGPLHTEFDGKGNAYTSVFISSEIVKWTLPGCEVVDRQPTFYSIGHLMIPGGDSKKPFGKYVIALNKITKDRYLPTGPELTQSAQLYDISGDKMRLLADFPTIGEPHYAQALPASLIEERQVRFFKVAENTHPMVVRAEKDAGISRRGKTVHVKMIAIRSHFTPDNIEGVQAGDTVLFHVTNIEQDWDIPHGFAVMGAQNAELLVMPGQTRTLKWVVPEKTGVYPFYCTDFCSALHQEMQGYVRVSPRGSTIALSANTSAKTEAQIRKLAASNNRLSGAGSAQR